MDSQGNNQKNDNGKTPTSCSMSVSVQVNGNTDTPNADNEHRAPNEMDQSEESVFVDIRPCRRPFEKEVGTWIINSFAKRIFDDVNGKILAEDAAASAESLTVDACKKLTSRFQAIWLTNGKESEFALEGLLFLLERALGQKKENFDFFFTMLETLGDSALTFLRAAVPYLVECDARNDTDYVEILMLYLNIYHAKTGVNLSKHLLSSVPHLGDFYLKTNAKTFAERFTFGKIMERRVVDVHGSTLIVNFPMCLQWRFFTPRRVVVSNAPPVRLRRKPVKSKITYECAPAAGGLVSGVTPCMRAEDLWVGFIEDAVVGMDRMPMIDLVKNIKRSNMLATKLQRFPAVMKATLSEGSQDEGGPTTEPMWFQTEVDLQRMRRMLDSFAEKNFVINPVIIMRREHRPFYNGISNGLLWPAFHNLHEYIIDEYKNEENRKVLHDDWSKYVAVNHYFALSTARRSRPQDFLWIHDYHLFLVGSILRSFSPDVHCGFFLHIPFLLSADFFENYWEQAIAILRGLLAFSRVGLQTQRDVDNFLALVRKHIPTATVLSECSIGLRRIFTVSYGGSVVDIGSFPISIDSEKLLEWTHERETIEEASELRRRLLEGRSDDSRLFVSVERLDYTKGIVERLLAFQLYLRQSAEANGKRKDMYYQIASSSRTDVSSYAEYRKRVTRLAEEINDEFGNCVHIDLENHPHRDVVKYYLAADVIVVTPIADGMNLVVKEAIICNPNAVYIFSTGSGAENQFSVAGLSDCYLRVSDINDVESFANTFKEAATMDRSLSKERGQLLFDFVKANNIQKWLDEYLDSDWYHDVIDVVELKSVQQFEDLIMKSRDHRRSIVKCILDHQPFKETSAISLENARRMLEDKRKGSADGESVVFNGVELNILDELNLLKKDCQFLSFYKSDADTDRFIDFLAESHPVSKKAFFDEMNVILRTLNFDLSDGIDVFITDWDGTIKTYACSYRTSIQPAYSAVLLSLFAKRYTKLAAVLTAGPLRHFGILDCTTVPWEDGHLTFGGSWGREWMLNGKRVADEKVLTREGAAALSSLTERVDQLLQEDGFSKFEMVGSGFQRKVDRITLGVQNFTKKIDAALSRRYVEAIKRELDEIDPKHRLFEIVELELDIEIVLKHNEDATAWTKANGIRFLLQTVGVDLAKGNVLICGDTVSDLPMVETACAVNPERTYSVFVNPSPEVKKKLAKMAHPQKHFFVGCPEVLHAVMAKQVLRPMFVMNEV